MGEVFDKVEGAIEDISSILDVPYPNPRPFTDVTALVVAWNEAERIGKLMAWLAEWFVPVVLGVQESTDGTLELAQEQLTKDSHTIVQEPHHGHGDASYPRLMQEVKTDWTFVVSCDEWPNEELLQTIWTAVAYADKFSYDGVWVPFKSFTEGVEWKVEHGHLRLFRSELGWPPTLHSRPPSKRAMWWPHGYIDHSRSLDEFIVDYLRYLEIGKGNAGWDAHNLSQIRGACVAVAELKGWEWVQRFPWWPQVEATVFKEDQPWRQ